MKTIALIKSSQIQCGGASNIDVAPPTRAWSTLLAPAQFHNGSHADPHTWQAPAQNAALLEESTRIGLDPSEWRGKRPENGTVEPCSHGTSLQVARQTRTRRQPSQFHYISRDHPNAHELTNHILVRHPSPEPGLLSPGAPGKWWRRWCGIVPVSPTGTTGSFPRTLWLGITYRIGILWSGSYTTGEPIDPNQPK